MKSAFVLACLLLITPSASLGRQAASLQERAGIAFQSAEASIIAARHDIHRNPELSGEEERTARLVADHLRQLGFDVRTGVGGHGVVGTLTGQLPGPAVAFRADMDAVRSSAPDPVPFRSETPGIRHICGHDVHVAVGLGLATAFAAIQPSLAGTVILIFQPAEERATGARAMLADAVFQPTMPEAIYAFHTAPYPVGTVATTAGGMMASRSGIRVQISGDGALPNAAASVRTLLASVSTVGPEAAFQVSPASVVLAQIQDARPAAGGLSVGGQIMTADVGVRDGVWDTIETGLNRIEAPGVTLTPTWDPGAIAGVTNDAALVARANQAIARHEPGITVAQVTGVVPAFSEDFGSFQDRVPGVMYFLGVSNPETGTVGMPHSPDYVADDQAIAVGVRAMAAVMLDKLGGS